MKGMGAIKNIEPIIDIEIIENQIPALVFLKKISFNLFRLQTSLQPFQRQASYTWQQVENNLAPSFAVKSILASA